MDRMRSAYGNPLAFVGRLTIWGSLLAFPAWITSTAYQEFLAKLSTALLHALGLPFTIFDVRIAAPMEIALFLALAASSSGPSHAGRLLRCLVGTGALLLLELVVLCLPPAVAWMSRGGPDQPPVLSPLLGNLLETVPWAGAPILWFLLFGTESELPPERLAIDDIRARP